MMKKLSKGQKGFSLLELLVAVSILAVGLLAAASMQGVALRSNTLSHRASTASMLAQQVMEDIYSWPRQDTKLKTLTPWQQYDLNQDPAAPEWTIMIEGSGIYRADYSITPNTPVPECTRIDVRVERTSNVDGGKVVSENTVKIDNRGQNVYTILTSYKRTVPL